MNQSKMYEEKMNIIKENINLEDLKNPVNYVPEWGGKTPEGFNTIRFIFRVFDVNLHVISMCTENKSRRTKKALETLANSEEVQDRLKEQLDKVVLLHDSECTRFCSINVARNPNTPIEILQALAEINTVCL